MTIRSRYVIAALALVMVPAAQSLYAQESTRLQDRMSASDFYDAGLNKLSAQELANLNQWLATHQGTSTAGVAAAAGAAASGADTAEIKPEHKRSFFFHRDKREAFKAHLVGHFTGWTGQNVVTLDNGQQWQQVGDDKPQCTSADNPEVKVKPSLFGNWLMDVPTCNLLVHVQRVK